MRCAVAFGVLAAASSAQAQYYPKTEYYDAAVVLLRDAVIGERQGTAAMVGALAQLQDPDLLPLFTAMMKSDQPATRIYGILGSGLAKGGTSFDTEAVLALKTPEERAAAIRESNATGLLRGTPIEALLQSRDLLPPTLVTLVGEQDRRGGTWDIELLRPVIKDEDASLAGVACMLMMGKGDSGPWNEFSERWKAMPEPTRSAVARALAEGAVVFQIEQAVEPLLQMAATTGTTDEAQMAAIGTALTLNPQRGLKAWQERVAARRSQPQLVRSGMQLLAADEKEIPASAFDALRNNTPTLDAIADAGKALRSGGDPTDALIGLLKSGHPMSGEWALLRARTLPPQQAAKVWRYLLSTMDLPNAEDRPTPIMLALAIRELMTSDPAAPKALVERARNQPLMAVALLSGVYDSGVPAGADIARALRGSLPRSGESLAALILARTNAPMSDDDLDVLGRAAAGGGDLENMRAAQAAWYLIKRRNKVPDAVGKIAGTPA